MSDETFPDYFLSSLVLGLQSYVPLNLGAYAVEEIESHTVIALVFLSASGKIDEELVHDAVPVWCFLRICETQGTREQEHRLDCRVCGPET